MSIIKKTIILLLQFCIFLPTIFLVFLQVQQLFIQHRMKEKLETAMMQTITIDLNKVVWVKQGKEIRVEGHLFDVKFYHSFKGKVFFTGLFDQEESRIEKQLSSLNEHDQSQDKIFVIVKLFSLLQSVFFSHQVEPDNFSQLHHSYYYHSSPLYNTFDPVLTPPPQQ